MQVGGTKIVIVVVHMHVIALTMVVMMWVVVVHPKDKDADAVDSQTENGHKNGLIKNYVDGVQQSVDTFPSHQKGKDGQEDRATVTTEGVYLSSPKTEAAVVCVTPCVDVCKSGDAQRRRMGGHVEAVRK